MSFPIKVKDMGGKELAEYFGTPLPVGAELAVDGVVYKVVGVRYAVWTAGDYADMHPICRIAVRNLEECAR